MGTRAWGTGIVMLVIFGRVAYAIDTVGIPFCPEVSVLDSIFGFRDTICLLNSRTGSHDGVGVIEGDEISLQRALNMVHKNSHQYVALLFYASWCPFSRNFRPRFFTLSTIYPSIPHFAVEESAIRPSILSKYGVHGFPTLFLVDSSMRVHYRGSRALDSLVAFYTDVTGIKAESLDKTSLDRLGHPSNYEKHNTTEDESCPFTWARSPENMLRQETYLALATAFVLLRLLYLFFPKLLVFAQLTWRRFVGNVVLGSFTEHPRAYLNRAIQLFNSLKEPCKRSNLQDGALNAKAWASKSLATISIGDASTSRGTGGSECH